MAGLLEWLSNQKDSAANDYADLMSNYPNAQKFGKGLIKAISEHVPSNEDFKSPEAMRNWGTAAALNAPMGLTFIGKNAANWNPVKAAEAEKLLNSGVDPAQVWKEHLIGRMPDKSLFSEIDDSRAFLKGNGNYNDLVMNRYNAFENTGRDMINNSLNVSDIYRHYPLSEEYPDLMKLKAEFIPKSKNTLGSFTGDAIQIRSDLPRKNAEYVIPHELQHAIQNKENWAMGGSPDTTLSDPLLKETIRLNLSDKLKSMDETVSNSALSDFGMNVSEMSPLQREIARTSLLKETRDGNTFQIPKNLTPYQLYRRLTGEAQARATQDRMNMNMQQRRDTYPLAGGKLSDIPLDQLINRYRDN
jgi:hypothetical protein